MGISVVTVSKFVLTMISVGSKMTIDYFFISENIISNENKLYNTSTGTVYTNVSLPYSVLTSESNFININALCLTFCISLALKLCYVADKPILQPVIKAYL